MLICFLKLTIESICQNPQILKKKTNVIFFENLSILYHIKKRKAYENTFVMNFQMKIYQRVELQHFILKF